MNGTQGFGQWIGALPMREHRVAAAVAVLMVLAPQCFDVRAELLFRSAEQIDGQQRWSAIKKYANPADIGNARVSERGAAPPAEEVRVFLSGPITRADLADAKVMAALVEGGRQKIADNSVWLASTGGDVDASMDLGRLLRKLGVFTLIGRNDRCFSACVFAFMGGERRIVAGQLGIHRPYFPLTQDFPERQAKFRHLQKTLRDFIEEMDFPPSLYEAVMAVPPESMKILASAELKAFYLEGISPSSEDIADAAAARRLGLSMLDYLLRKAQAPACALPVPGAGRCESRAQEAAARGGAADDPGGQQKGEAAPSGGAVARGAPGVLVLEAGPGPD